MSQARPAGSSQQRVELMKHGRLRVIHAPVVVEERRSENGIFRHEFEDLIARRELPQSSALGQMHFTAVVANAYEKITQTIRSK
jgi:hypothetical protein